MFLYIKYRISRVISGIKKRRYLKKNKSSTNYIY